MVELMGWLRGSRTLRCRHRTEVAWIGLMALGISMGGRREGTSTCWNKSHKKEYTMTHLPRWDLASGIWQDTELEKQNKNQISVRYRPHPAFHSGDFTFAGRSSPHHSVKVSIQLPSCPPSEYP
jgi:hypothetical protein